MAKDRDALKLILKETEALQGPWSRCRRINMIYISRHYNVQGLTEGAAGLQPTPRPAPGTPENLNLKRHRFCRYDIKSFT
jgi:hypothetical protein